MSPGNIVVGRFFRMFYIGLGFRYIPIDLEVGDPAKEIERLMCPLRILKRVCATKGTPTNADSRNYLIPNTRGYLGEGACVSNVTYLLF